MRIAVLWLLAAGQLALAAEPALAARPDLDAQTRVGLFAGAQLKVPLGGRGGRAEAPRASVGIAPLARRHGFDGPGEARIGEGLQFRLTPNRPLELAFAGTRLDRLGLTRGGEGAYGERAGVSTLGWIAIGVGATALVVVAAGAICLSDSDCIPDDD